MDQQDRDMLIRIDENVKHLKHAVPVIAKKVEKHDAIITVICFIGLVISLVFTGAWEKFFK